MKAPAFQRGRGTIPFFPTAALAYTVPAFRESEEESALGMPDKEAMDAVGALVPEVMEAKTRLPPGRAGIILVASIPPLMVTTTKDGEEIVLRDLHFPQWVYRTVVDPEGRQNPIPAAGQEIDRVRYYLSLAAGHRIPIGAYFYTRTSHAAVYRGWDDMFLGVLDPFELERLTDDQIYGRVRGWYGSTEKWLAVVPRGSVLDVAIISRMRGFVAADRRDACLGAYACLETLAKAQATTRSWLDQIPDRDPRISGRRMDRAIEALLHRWSARQVGSARDWRKARVKLAHPYAGPPAEQRVGDLTRELMLASRAVLLGILDEVTAARSQPVATPQQPGPVDTKSHQRC